MILANGHTDNIVFIFFQFQLKLVASENERIPSSDRPWEKSKNNHLD